MKNLPSVLSKGIALNRITITKSRRHTFRNTRKIKIKKFFYKMWSITNWLPCLLAVDNRFVSFCLFDLDSTRHKWIAVYQLCFAQNLHDILVWYLSAVYLTIWKPIFVLLPPFRSVVFRNYLNFVKINQRQSEY